MVLEEVEEGGGVDGGWGCVGIVMWFGRCVGGFGDLGEEVEEGGYVNVVVVLGFCEFDVVFDWERWLVFVVLGD